MTLAESLLRHFEAASAQAWATLPVLTDPKLGPPCSPDSIAAMRRLELASSYLQAVGFIEDAHLRCSGSGMHGDDYPLPGITYTNNLGTDSPTSDVVRHIIAIAGRTYTSEALLESLGLSE